jgi:hypothetical protein
MMREWRYGQMAGILAAVTLAVLALGSPVRAQEPAPPSPATLVEEVEVIGRLPGPWCICRPARP